jgi:hypothetical protein
MKYGTIQVTYRFDKRKVVQDAAGAAGAKARSNASHLLN